MVSLSVVIPARNEEFLKETVEDLIRNRRGDTEIIVGLDGQSEYNFLHPQVITVAYPESIGQRAIGNRCVEIARGEYIMKVDAHCAFDEGYDVKIVEGFKGHENDCMVPFMRNLHVYDWKCYKCGKKVYQDKTPVCPVDGEKMNKKMIWQPRPGTWNCAYCFDSEPHFQYHSEQNGKNKASPNPIVETMSLQGSCFVCSKKQYLALGICDEEFGSWGSQGIEVACKFWLSGNGVYSNKNTWYAHCFRTKSIFGFPYQLSGKQVGRAKRRARELFFEHKWDKQVRSLRWLIERFNPPGWTPEEIAKLK